MNLSRISVTGFRGINNDFYWNLLMDYDWFLQYDWDRHIL